MRSPCLWLLVVLVGLGRPAAGQAPAPADSLRAQARRVIAQLTDSSLAGRGYGPADGARRAARLLAGRFRALGLLPLGDSAGSYYQHFPLPVNVFPGQLDLVAGRHALRPGADFIAESACPPTRLRARVVVLDTSAWHLPDSAAVLRRLRPRAWRGRVLVLRAADEKRLPLLPHAARAALSTAAAVLVLEPRKLTASLAPRQAAQPRLRVLAAAWPAGAKRATVTVDSHLEPAWPALNVLARLPGTDPGAADSVLWVSAHYDHLGQQGRATYFPGANDNASGVAMLLAVAAELRARPLRHPVVFALFGAEEAGLVGSGWCVAHPPVPLGRIRFLLNLDLLGSGDEGLGVVGATLHPRRFQLLDSLNRQLQAVPRFKQRGRAANSDHFPFAERGVPAFFVYTMGGPPYYHDVLDRAATLTLSRFAEVCELLGRFLRAVDRP